MKTREADHNTKNTDVKHAKGSIKMPTRLLLTNKMPKMGKLNVSLLHLRLMMVQFHLQIL